MKKNKLPEKRNFNWKLKPFESAKTSLIKEPNGQIIVSIDHEILKGITCEMLVWWFNKFTMIEIELDGTIYPAYHIWHPYDHIGVEGKTAIKGLMQKGDKLHINECFERNYKYYVDNTTDILKLDNDGLILSGKKFGKEVMRLHHSFTQMPQGVLYRSKMTIGINDGLLRPFFNRFIAPQIINEEKAKVWLKHNIEEVGSFESFLPKLYANRNQGNLIKI